MQSLCNPVVPLPHAVPTRGTYPARAHLLDEGVRAQGSCLHLFCASNKTLYLVSAWMSAVCPSLGIRRLHGGAQCGVAAAGNLPWPQLPRAWDTYLMESAA